MDIQVFGQSAMNIVAWQKSNHENQRKYAHGYFDGHSLARKGAPCSCHNIEFANFSQNRTLRIVGHYRINSSSTALLMHVRLLDQ